LAGYGDNPRRLQQLKILTVSRSRNIKAAAHRQNIPEKAVVGGALYGSAVLFFQPFFEKSGGFGDYRLPISASGYRQAKSFAAAFS